jgi:hypothetical protein
VVRGEAVERETHVVGIEVGNNGSEGGGEMRKRELLLPLENSLSHFGSGDVGANQEWALCSDE